MYMYVCIPLSYHNWTLLVVTQVILVGWSSHTLIRQLLSVLAMSSKMKIVGCKLMVYQDQDPSWKGYEHLYYCILIFIIKSLYEYLYMYRVLENSHPYKLETLSIQTINAQFCYWIFTVSLAYQIIQWNIEISHVFQTPHL